MEFPEAFFEDEVRDGFYVSSLMKRSWAAQLELLNTVIDICKRQGIQCFAEWGTLLGAVRHGGMIPWDDDVDICMKREDYIKFLSVADKELPDGCWVMDYRTSDEIDNLVGRVLNSRMYVVEGEQLEQYHGFPYMVGIDIFPLDYLPVSPSEEEQFANLLKKIVLLVQKVYKKKNKLEEITQDEIDTGKKDLERIFGISFDDEKPLNQQLYALIEDRMSSIYRTAEANDLTNFSVYVQSTAYKMQKKYFEDTVFLPFENMKIPVPLGYDYLLSKYKYGNYMKPIRTGGSHDYPVYKKQQEYLSEELGISIYEYKFSKEEIKREEYFQKETLQKKVNSFFPLFHEAHENIKILLCAGDYNSSLKLLEDCQNVAIEIGIMIEKERGNRHRTVKILEKYCEMIYQIHEQLYEWIAKGEKQENFINEIVKEFIEFERKLSSSIECDLKEKKEVVFIPYKASYWDSMKSMWETAIEDEDSNVYVIPAPYFYKDAYGQVKKDNPCYENNGFPEDVKITSYETYNFQVRHPDVIIIQCPYDEYNYAMTLHPFFYASNLKKYTEQLIYIPALVMDEIGPEDERAREMLKAYCNMPGVINADKVIVQSEQMKEVYVELLTEFAGDETKEMWRNKILDANSLGYNIDDKYESIMENLPDQWLYVMKKPDGRRKKIILYSTSASALFCNGRRMIEKMEEVFQIFRNCQDEVALIWRPDPQTREVLRRQYSKLWQKYRNLVQIYREDAWGIYDDSPDAQRAILLCDACYGDGGTTLNACRVQKKPVMLQNV